MADERDPQGDDDRTADAARAARAEASGSVPAAPDGADAQVEKVERMELDEPRFETDVESDAVMVRRAPKYGAFLAAGAVVGILLALILTFAFSGQPTIENDVVRFDRGQIFGFLMLGCVTIGAAAGALVALVIDRGSSRRARRAIAERESTRFADDA